MPYLSKGPVPVASTVETLKAAVARWDGEGGAGVHGPQEGYGVGQPLSNSSGPVAAVVGAKGHEMHLDRLVRLLFAASSIRKESLALGTLTNPGTLSLGTARRSKVDEERLSRVLLRMTRKPFPRVTRMDDPS